MEVQPIVLTVAEFATVHKISKSQVYALMRAGAVRARKIGARTAIFSEDNPRWQEGFPFFPVRGK
jgi:hypothetical protein